LLDACEKYLPRDICTWETPDVGMFVWVDIDWRRHPSAKSLAEGGDDQVVLDIEDRIFKRSVEDLVMVNKGSWFRGEKGSVDGVKFRLTFAAAPEGELEEAAKRFGEALRAEFGLS
jgi:aromatic amino acid aminotransferase I / 2-aminoadipate transaminase